MICFWLLQLVTRLTFIVDYRRWQYMCLMLSFFPFAFPERDAFLWPKLKLKSW
jgi:hypothetical protein